MKKVFTIAHLMLAGCLMAGAQVSLGGKVPNFKAIDQHGKDWSLNKEIKSAQYLVLYFYPAAFTGGCTTQACSYRDQKEDLEGVNAKVVGISGDTPETLALFAQEHRLNYTLLSDETGEIAKLFGVPQNEGGVVQREIQGKRWDLARGTTIQRWTFILDRKGTMIYKDAEVSATEDSGKVLEFLSSL